jgi:hypothetical protein
VSTLQSPPRPTDPTSRAVRTILDAPHFDDRADWLAPHRETRPCGLTGRLVDVYDWEAILGWPWGSLRIALQVAADIDKQAGGAVLSDVIVSLDRELQTRVLQALRIRCGLEEMAW